jgi:hypothetical protein
MNRRYNIKKQVFRMLVFSLAALLMSCNKNKALDPSKDFGAYYTHIVTSDEFEKYSRTGDYADIIVDLGKENGKFVFWRGSSYLPYWETAKGEKVYADEIIPRSGDGSKTMPDKVNSFSVVKIIENTANTVVVHWRYLPVFGKGNPHSEVIVNNFVDEYFTFSPNGTVQRTIKQGTPKFDDWADPKFQYVQTFNLTTKGIADKILNQPVRSLKPEKVSGRTLIPESVVKPVAWFKFDEAVGDTTYESLSNSGMEVKGPKTYWRSGISGTALQFDDVSTFLSLPASAAPSPESAITLEGWVSIGAYPWSWCPIVQQADDVPEELLTDEQAGIMGIVFKSNDVKYKKEDDTGYFLGIDGHGHPGMKIRVGGNWEELTSDLHLERKNWYHITGTYDKTSGKISLYVNGKLAGEKKVANPGNIELSTKNLQIGRGKDRRQTDPVRGNTFPDSYSFDGLIDEIKIYDQALSQEQIQKSFANYKTTPEMLASSDIPPRVLPTGDKTDKFGAQYSALRYFDTWDNLFRFSKGADVVVSLGDNPSKFVFWRGVSYIPMIVNEKNEWYSNEFNETWSKSGGNGCQEPMSDKSSAYSHVRVLENTPARVVVQWRFSLLDVNHVLANYNDTTGWSDWSDWYYYIYPDGVAAKKMQLWTNGERNHEWQESMAIFGPDQHPHDIVERTKTVTMLAEDGKYKEYDWQNSPPKNIEEPKNSNIQLINYKGDYDPFTIGTKFEKTNVYGGELTPYAVFCTWNHWPIAQMPSDGRYASYPDRTSHSSFTHVFLPKYKEVYGDKPYYEKLMLEGMWNKKSTDLIPLSKSWTHAPGLTNIKSAEGGYDISQRAYVLKVSGNSVSFTVNASTESPIQNLCFVLKGWDSKDDVKVNVSGNVKQGTIRDTDGTYTKVIYIEKEGIEPLKISISK